MQPMSFVEESRRWLLQRAGLSGAASLGLMGAPLAPAAAMGATTAATSAGDGASVVEGPADVAAAAALRSGGAVVLLRHARTEAGIGDPPGFDLSICSSQRQLDAQGRAQSERIGAWFARRALEPAAVRSSQWCRCLDTASLAFPARGVQPWEPLNSTFADRADRSARQAADARRALAQWRTRPGFEVWVTHMVNVQAIAGVFVAMGEAVVVKAAPEPGGAPRVLAQWRPGG